MHSFKRFLKGENCVYSHRIVERIIEKAGLRKVNTLLFSPIMYRRMPAWFLRDLDVMEKILPRRWRVRAFWACMMNLE